MARKIQEALASAPPRTTEGSLRPVVYMDTIDAYNKWAEVYDTDGNFLQALDTIQMRRLLPLFLDRVTSAIPASQTESTKFVDLGCGTGRNTLQLLKDAPSEAEVVGLDASVGMLEVARATLEKDDTASQFEVKKKKKEALLDTFDLLQFPPIPPACALGAAGVISTLVLEHIPAQAFFEGAAALLQPGGYLLVTNMHSDMGAISQAGFVDVATGVKIRPTSYAHTIEEVLVAAERAGFQVETLDGEEVRETKVDEDMVESLGLRAKKWVGVVVWFGICFKMRAC